MRKYSRLATLLVLTTIVLSTLCYAEEVFRNHYTGSSLLATVDDNDNIKYFHADRLGSNRLTTNPENEQTTIFLSLPFGQTLVDEGITHSYTGKEQDKNSNLHYFRARYYDSTLGKFTKVDPIASNPSYAYAVNNPITFIDPSGMDHEEATLDDNLVSPPDTGPSSGDSAVAFSDNTNVAEPETKHYDIHFILSEDLYNSMYYGFNDLGEEAGMKHVLDIILGAKFENGETFFPLGPRGFAGISTVSIDFSKNKLKVKYSLISSAAEFINLKGRMYEEYSYELVHAHGADQGQSLWFAPNRQATGDEYYLTRNMLERLNIQSPTTEECLLYSCKAGAGADSSFAQTYSNAISTPVFADSTSMIKPKYRNTGQIISTGFNIGGGDLLKFNPN